MKKLSLFLLLISSQFAVAVGLTGKVTDNSGAPLAYVTVFIKGTTKGTTTNLEGNYKLEVAEGNFTIVFKYLGYKTEEKNIVITPLPAELNAVMTTESFQLTSVTIRAGDEDPAYAIIRHAITKRKFYLNQVDAYSCNVYIKGLQKLIKYPKKMMGVKVDFGGLLDSTSGIFYLSESVSKFNFKKPGNIHEEMISSRVSGSNKAFSFNQASEMMFNFYEGIVGARAVSDRGFISPISPTAFLYYRYRLEGTTVENNQLINKIEVIPKRKFDPVFAGYIYIAENLWRIQSVDLFLTKNAGIEFIDTLHIKQVHLPVDDKSDIWMPVNSRFDFRFGFLGFEGGGTYVSVQSDYVINPVTEKKFFSGEILKIKEDANKKDSAYWQQVRPIPLTQEEVKDYVHKDSIAIVRDSKSFKDSVDRITNKFSPVSFVLTGYDYRNRYHKINLHFSSVLQSLQYNTIEGVNLNFETEFVKEYEKKKKFFVSPNFRYGFSNRHFNSNIGIGYLYNHIKKSEIKIAGGSDVAQFNGDKPVSSFINTFYSLFEEKNYLKIFEKHFALLEYKTELVNGINLKLNSEYAQRFPLQNTSAVKWKNFSDREFTTNLPATIENPFVTFTKNNSFVSFAEIKIHIKQKYISRPETKYILESKFPVLILQYKKGIKKLVQSNVDFDECTLGLEHEIAFGMLGHLNYSGYYHQFINSKKVFISDYRQFMGNQTIFSGFTLNSFNMLDYYAYSTTQPSFEIHGEYHFNGLLFNKIPLLRSLHFDEIVSAHFLHVKGLPKYLELSAGVEKLGFLRFDVVTSFTADKKTATALRVGIKLQ